MTTYNYLLYQLPTHITNNIYIFCWLNSQKGAIMALIVW